MAWFKMYEGVSSDAKWPAIARIAGVNVGTVAAVWLAMLDHASQSPERGSLENFDPEIVDAYYGYDDGVCQRVYEAMEAKSLIVDRRLANWGKRQLRQAAKSDGGLAKSNAERQKEYRERQKCLRNAAVTERNESVTQRNESVTASNVTVTQRNVTVTENNGGVTERNESVTALKREDKIREEKIREESFCAELSCDSSTPAPALVEEAVIYLPLNAGPEHAVPRSKLQEWQELYPAVDVMQQLRNMRGWLLENTRRRKTKSGIGRFITGWLADEQNKAGQSRASPFHAAKKESEGDRAARKTWENFKRLEEQGAL